MGGKIQFQEQDPTFVDGGKKVVAASALITEQKIAPPGLVVIDLEALDATPSAAPSTDGDADEDGEGAE